MLHQKTSNKMETEPLNGSEEITPMLATSFPDNHSESQSAHSIQETSRIINEDAKSLETNSQWQEAKVEGPPTSCDSDPSYEDSIDESMDNDEEQKPKLTTHQKLSMVLIILATLANTMSFSILAAFFPIEVCKEKNISLKGHVALDRSSWSLKSV